MKNFCLSVASGSSPGFALICVLALVSLAALSATAFLASARLQSQATRSLYNNTRLEMALQAGSHLARETVDYAPDRHFNFVTTYWRGPNTGDWTNELGYMLNGAVYSTNTRTDLRYNFYCCFSTARFTNLSNVASALLVVSNVVTNQGTFRVQMADFMRTNATNFLSGESVNIPLLGDNPNDPTKRYTSPPVGWVYIRQEVRTKPGTTNTTNIPVVRFAFYVQDLGGMIDAERAGGSSRDTGTNPSEISLTNAVGTSFFSNSNLVAAFTTADNRPKYLTPGLLLRSGSLATNDLRYVASGLRAWSSAYARIPIGLGYNQSGTLKLWLNSNNYINDGSFVRTNLLTNIFGTIQNNLPAFTNRAGGMNGITYLYALAANIIDYADNNSSATSTNVSGTNIIGFDSYPMLTHVFDGFTYDKDAKTITIVTYLQFWNPSKNSTPVLSGGFFSYKLNDTLLYPTNSSFTFFTNRPLTNSVLNNSNFSFGTTSYSFPPNSGFITSITNTIDLAKFPNFPATAPDSLKLNQIADGDLPTNNTYTLVLSDTTNIPAMTIYRNDRILTSGTTEYVGSIVGLQIQSFGQPWRTADPRMTPYLGIGGSTRYDVSSITNSYFQGYPAQELLSGPLYANPMNWPDGTNTTSRIPPVRGITNPTTPPLGSFTIQDPITLKADPAPCIISDFGSYTNICELGNIFDPIQWAPPPSLNNFANCNINTNPSSGPVWTKDNLYGGGSTLRIGRPEHLAFAFTNLTVSGIPVPNMQISAAGLLDIFCAANKYDEGGQINLNTAPAPVLRALGGGVTLTSDPNLVNSAGTNTPNHPIPPGLAEAFAQGVMRFRHVYPFYSPSQICFIGTNPDWPNTNSWPTNAVFGNKEDIFLAGTAPGNVSGARTNINVNSWSDQAAEEWFSKIYALSTTQSRNYRCYVVAQLVNSNGIGIGPVARKYFHLYAEQNSTSETNDVSNISTFRIFESKY